MVNTADMFYTVDMVYTVDTAYTVYTIQTVLHCLTISMYAYIVRKGYNAIGVGRGAMSKMCDSVMVDYNL